MRWREGKEEGRMTSDWLMFLRSRSFFGSSVPAVFAHSLPACHTTPHHTTPNALTSARCFDLPLFSSSLPGQKGGERRADQVHQVQLARALHVAAVVSDALLGADRQREEAVRARGVLVHLPPSTRQRRSCALRGSHKWEKMSARKHSCHT